jgi:membrane protease YdiL (CAAX protease family)
MAFDLSVPRGGPDGKSTVATEPPASAGLSDLDVLEALLAVGLVTAISLAPFVGYNPHHGGGRAVLVGLGSLTLLAAFLRRARSVRLGLALTATIAAFALPWEVSWWPLPGALGVMVYVWCPIAARDPSVGRIAWRLGRRTPSVAWAILGLVVASASTLLAFHHLSHPGLGFGTELVEALPTWSLAAAGLAFVTVNAAVEEFLFRGAILHHLRQALGAWPAVTLQAAAFGLLHLHGYPYGPIGVLLASIYGLLLGAVRLRSNGLLAPWIAHVLADSVIFIFILQAATRSS